MIDPQDNAPLDYEHTISKTEVDDICKPVIDKFVEEVLEGLRRVCFLYAFFVEYLLVFSSRQLFVSVLRIWENGLRKSSKPQQS